jgi:hypothetical protein
MEKMKKYKDRYILIQGDPRRFKIDILLPEEWDNMTKKELEKVPVYRLVLERVWRKDKK